MPYAPLSPVRLWHDAAGAVLSAFLPEDGDCRFDPHTGKYRLLLVSDGEAHSRLAREEDVEAGNTPQAIEKPLPLKLSTAAIRKGFADLYRHPQAIYENKPLHTKP